MGQAHLVVCQHDVVLGHVLFQPLLNVGVQEPDLEDGLRILEALGHVEVTEAEESNKRAFTKTGVGVMITIFCDFCKIFGIKIGVFSQKPML
jgi:hypothetical protein